MRTDSRLTTFTYTFRLMKATCRFRELGGTLLIVRKLNDCLTVERNRLSEPTVVSVEGEWTEEEKECALHFYKTSTCFRR